jgi:hypothetical protein
VLFAIGETGLRGNRLLPGNPVIRDKRKGLELRSGSGPRARSGDNFEDEQLLVVGAIKRRALSKEINAALVVALSGAVAVLVARGYGLPSAEGLLSGVLSNPVPRTRGRTRGEASLPARRSSIAA